MFLILHQILLVESLWDVDSCRLVSVGSDSVSSLLGLEDSVWASCANQVTVIQESSLQTQVDQRLTCLKSCLPLIMDSKSLIRICGTFLEDVYMVFGLHSCWLPWRPSRTRAAESLCSRTKLLKKVDRHCLALPEV